MSIVQAIETDTANAVGVANRPEGLSEIHHPSCAAVIWRRLPSPDVQSWIDGLAPEQLPRARVILRPGDVRDVATGICEACGTPDCRERERLVDDTAALADIFAGLTLAPYLRLRLDVITTNACRRFHVDTITARLICTYRGTGTQYGISADGTEPGRVLTVPTGAPILMRGMLWPEHPKSGLLHRSPPIEGTGETRLVLVLDPIADPQDQPDLTIIH
ncbi:MAG: DUF1826 domain-containing protein [Pseudomonadota bacterium]